MSVPELGWRLRQAVKVLAERNGAGLAPPSRPQGQCGLPWVAELPRGFDPGPYLSSADAILAGRFDLFALKGLQLGFPPRWNADPKTGLGAPLRFGKSIDYRNASICGDIKYLWELNRHLELVTLAQAWHLSADPRYSKGCRELLESWFEQCPYPLGPNWTSSLEHGIRLINWSVAWHLLGGERSPLFEGEAGQRFRAEWLQAVRQHCHFIAGWPSRYSSANNHLLGEYAGLFVGALTWPLWVESAEWLARAHRGVEHEGLVQVAPDGVNREQAVWYQLSVTELLILCGLFGRSNGIVFPPAFWERLEAGIDYLAALMDRSGEVPMLGDSDDAVIVRWTPGMRAGAYRSLIATGMTLFSRSDWKDRAGEFDERNRWLLGDAAAEAFRRVGTGRVATRRRAFPVGGRYILGDCFGAANEILATLDAGPIGYPSIAAHGHADALSMTLSAGGVQLLIDPGTFAYHGEAKWRSYFRSTFAHNTVCIDGLDQSESGGNFLWLRKAQARCMRFEPDEAVQWFEAEHDGYARLPDPVVHRRRVTFDSVRRRFEIEDAFDCQGRHLAQVCWHLSETCTVDAFVDRVHARARGVELVLTAPFASSAPRVIVGQLDPPAGWVSRSFDSKRPCPMVVWEHSVQGRTRFLTTIELRFLRDDLTTPPISSEPPA